MKNPAKMWKFNKKDQEEAKYWDDYKKMYEDCFEHCNVVPWTIVPSDQNWYKEYVITKEVFDTLTGLNMKYPRLEEKMDD
jgi:polyphosphate kinase 2 (PPK2 family)